MAAIILRPAVLSGTHPPNLPLPPAPPHLTPPPADVPTILHLIQALAIYEKEPLTTVTATEATLTSTLFPTSPSPRYASCILAYIGAEAVGMAIYFTSYSTWRAQPGIYLEDLFVRDDFRGRGVGTALLARLAKEVQRIGGARLEWCVLRWNEPSIKFYESIGAKDQGVEWKVMRVDREALRELAERGPEVRWEGES